MKLLARLFERLRDSNPVVWAAGAVAVLCVFWLVAIVLCLHFLLQLALELSERVIVL